ncbi:MAG TPA: HAD domain-containing protein [Candidatus Paceibacterota bacterium]
MLLFLDFDGVMHPRAPAGKYFSSLSRLEGVLRDYQFLEIVIASTWREAMGIEELRKHFSPEMRHRVVGVTPIHDIDPFEELIGSRQREVEDYLEQAGEDCLWLALDDEEGLYDPDCPNLIKCLSLIGFDDRAEAELRNRLSAVFGSEGL